jgi:hypothetical protein
LKIEVDQTVADEWIELDAVEVIGSVTGMYLLISEIRKMSGNVFVLGVSVFWLFL